MKHFKKVLAAALVVALAFSATACGGNETKGSGTSIKVGAIGPITGNAAVYGKAVQNGAQLAVDEINAAGGDVTFEFNYQDDENDAEKSLNAYSKLKDWGLQILLGTVTTTPCIAVAGETFADRVFEITPSASSNSVTEGKDNVFQLCFTDPNQGATAAKSLLEKGLGTNIAAIYNNADPYSTGVFNAFKSELEANGKKIVYTGTFSSDDNADFSVQLAGAKAANADLIFLPIYYTPASLIVAQAKSMGYPVQFFGVDGIDGILTLEGFDTSLAEGFILMTPFNPWSEDEKVAKFVKSYEEKYGEKPNQFAADAYDCIYVIHDLCEKGSITPDMSAEDVCEALVPVITASDFSFDGLTGHQMKWGANGEVSKDPVLCKIENSQYKDM